MGAARQKWEDLTQHPAVVDFFRDLFSSTGVHIEDTQEEFTCHHRGDKIEFEDGIDPAQVDYTVTISMAQVDRLAAHAATGQLSDEEKFRIVSALFTPATAATLKNPLLSDPYLRRLAGAESVIHVRMVSDSAALDPVQHTLIYAHRQWFVIPGLQGNPARVFEFGLADALDYHRRAFHALKKNRMGTWMKFTMWYRSWRKKVSAPAPPAHKQSSIGSGSKPGRLQAEG